MHSIPTPWRAGPWDERGDTPSTTASHGVSVADCICLAERVVCAEADVVDALAFASKLFCDGPGLGERLDEL